jgi:aminopeptidase N
MTFYFKYFFVVVFGLFVALANAQISIQKIHAKVQPQMESKSISGTVQVTFSAVKKSDTLVLDAKNMQVKEVTFRKKALPFLYDQKQLKIVGKWNKGINQLQIVYQATPKQTLYFTNYENHPQIWTQGQGKYTSHWLPSVDDIIQKILFSMEITYDHTFTVLSNGKLIHKITQNNLTTWHYQMQQPMSSYLLMLAIGDFEKQEVQTKLKTTLEWYLPKNHENYWESTYKNSVEIFSYLENRLQVPYPWAIYRQVPVYDFLYAGMENTTSTIFSSEFMVDAIGYHDRPYENVNAHELAHQWFGNLVTSKTSEHHWLHEGFATYYALQAEKHLFGEDYFVQKIYETASTLQRASKEDPLLVVSSNGSSLAYYQKGAWAILALEHLIGTEALDASVKKFLQQYAFQSATTNDFLKIVTEVSKQNVDAFAQKWLFEKGFPLTEVLTILKKYPIMDQWFRLVELQPLPISEKTNELEEIWSQNQPWLQEEILKQLYPVDSEEKKVFVQKALSSNHIEVQQMAAALANEVPVEWKSLYEVLLEAPSYVTREIALQNLWQSFSEERKKYLNQTKQMVGLQDKNIRTTWLSLALITEGLDNKLAYYDELLQYATPNFPSYVRRNAIEKLLYLNPNDTNVYELLADGLVHHRWQFVQFCKDTIREQIKVKAKKEYYQKMLQSLPEKNRQALERLLGEVKN